MRQGRLDDGRLDTQPGELAGDATRAPAREPPLVGDEGRGKGAIVDQAVALQSFEGGPDCLLVVAFGAQPAGEFGPRARPRCRLRSCHPLVPVNVFSKSEQQKEPGNLPGSRERACRFWQDHYYCTASLWTCDVRLR